MEAEGEVSDFGDLSKQPIFPANQDAGASFAQDDGSTSDASCSTV